MIGPGSLPRFPGRRLKKSALAYLATAIAEAQASRARPVAP